MSAFGDADPDDGWDATDPVVLQLDNIARRIANLLDLTRSYAPVERSARVSSLFEDLYTVRRRIVDRDNLS